MAVEIYYLPPPKIQAALPKNNPIAVQAYPLTSTFLPKYRGGRTTSTHFDSVMDDTAEASFVTERLADFVTYGPEQRKLMCSRRGSTRVTTRSFWN